MSTYYGSLSLIESTADASSWKLDDIQPHVSLRLKQIFPKIPTHSRCPFYLNNTPDVAADLKWLMSRYPLKISEEDRSILLSANQYYLDKQHATEAILSPTHCPTVRVGCKPGQSLRRYQLTALDFIEVQKSALILDELGLGKTYVGLGIATLPLARPLVVVVQPHLHEQWNGKANSFLDAVVHKVKTNKPYTLPDADVYLMKYSQLASWVEVLTEGWVKSIAFDEIQELRRGDESAKGAAAQEICRHVDVKVGLTASLIYNYGIESFNIANIIRPGILGNQYEFLREWCDQGNSKGIVKEPDALGAYLREQGLVLRRTKEDVGQQAKQLSPHVEWVDPNTKAVSDMEALTQQLAIKTFSSNFAESGQAAREFDLKMRQMTGIAKARATAAYVRMFVETGTPVLLFGWHHEVYEIWKQELGDLNPLFYTGAQTPTQKERNKQAFIAGDSKLLIMSLRSGAGADGLQHACSTVIFGEFDWSGEVHRQCIGRVDRDGQKEEVFTFYVATQFGSDPEMLDTIGLKKSQAKGILDPYKAPISKQTDPNRIRRLATRYLKSKGFNTPQKTKTVQNMNNEQLVSLF